MTTERYYGKYRGTVENNVDDRETGRIEVGVSTVMGAGNKNWAMPCVPYAGNGVGLFAIPPRGTSVWVEFEGGDPGRPIWTGCFWNEGEKPVDPYTVDKKVLKTAQGTITINDASDSAGITIETNSNPKMKIVLDSNGIEINTGNSKIMLAANPKQVSINDGALEVI